MQPSITHRALPTPQAPSCLIFIYAVTIIELMSESVVLRPWPRIAPNLRTDCQLLENIMLDLVKP